MSKKISVLIPMYNEIKTAPDTARTLSGYMKKTFGDDYEIVFFDDGSTDGCSNEVKKLGLDNVRVEGYSVNKGKGGAVRCGIGHCQGDIIVCTDCDLAYGCDAILDIYNKIVDGGHHIVIGSRNLSSDGYEGYTALRRIMSKLYIKVVSFIAGFRYTDSQCGLKAYCAEAAKSVFDKCEVNGFAFDLEVLLLAEKMKFKIAEIPVKVINHRKTESKVKPFRDACRMLGEISRIKKRIKKIKL